MDRNLELLFKISDLYKEFDKTIVFVEVADGEKCSHLQILRNRLPFIIFSSERRDSIEVCFEGVSRLTSLYEIVKCIECLRGSGYSVSYTSHRSDELRYQIVCQSY